MKLAAVVGAAVVALGLIAVVVFAKSSPPRSAGASTSTTTGAPTSRATEAPPIPQTRISIVSREVPVSRGVARVRLSCQMGEAIRLTCRGVLSLRTTTGALLGRARFAIPNCCSAPWHVIAVRLTRAGTTLPLRARLQAVLDRSAASDTRFERLVSSG